MASATEPCTSSKGRAADAGLVIWSLGTVCEFQSPDAAVVRQNVQSCREFVQLAQDLGARGVKVRPNGFPKDADPEKTLEQIGRALRECGAADALYEPDKRRISICYELVDALAELFAAGATSEEDVQQAGIAVAGATLFVFFHEAGHALIRLDALPVTGREEDAVDQLATRQGAQHDRNVEPQPLLAHEQAALLEVPAILRQ